MATHQVREVLELTQGPRANKLGLDLKLVGSKDLALTTRCPWQHKGAVQMLAIA